MLCPFDAGCWNECCNALINGLALKQSVKRRTPMIIARLGIQAAPENKEEAMRVMLPLLGPIRAKSGCIACDFYQGMEDKMQLILVEQWESLADLERHIRSDHYRQVLSWMEMSVDPPEIHFDTVTDSGGLEIVETARGVP